MIDKLLSSYPILKNEPAHITQLILDSLAEHIALVDKSGEIITTNEAWNKFARENASDSPGRLGVGANYLEVCKNSMRTDKSVEDFYLNFELVLNGEIDNFALEYPCHSETENRWFIVSATPFKIDHETIGAIVSHFNITRRKLTEFELQKLASTDPLTGIMNRNAGLEYVQKNIQLCSRYGSIFTLCYLDVDNLKKVNDTYGHSEGDGLILRVVKIIREVLRETDEMCRLGGDEFLIIFPNTSANRADTIINRINKNVDHQNKESTKPYKIEISYGTAEYDPKNKLTADELIYLADHNMYKMKKSKNRKSGIAR